MRVLLVYPTSPRTRWPVGVFHSYWIPTGLAYLAAALRKAGHQVRIHIREEHLIKNGFDWPAADAALRTLIAEFRPEMLGLSVVTPMVPEAALIARMARETCGRDVLIVAGGAQATAVPELLFRDCPDLDVIVIGEGEETIVELADSGPSAGVAGLALREGNKGTGSPSQSFSEAEKRGQEHFSQTAARNEPVPFFPPVPFFRTPVRRPPADLDRLGPPAFDLLDMKFHATPNRWMIHWLELAAANVRTSRGCTGRCEFCGGHLVCGVGMRYHSLDYVLDQVLRVVNDYGFEAIHFEDDTLGANRGRLLKLCEALRRHDLHRRIRWDCGLRVDQADAELLAEMKSAGCIQVEYGFESGSDDSLRRLGKGASADLNRRAVELTRQAGLRIFADIMVGLPGETIEDFRATLRFVRWARAEIVLAFRLCPLPGTPIYEGLSQEVRDSLDWADYTLMDRPGPSIQKLNFTAMSDRQLERAYRRFRKYVVRPQQLWALRRDTPRGQGDVRRGLSRELVKFVLRHPLRAARAPW